MAFGLQIAASLSKTSCLGRVCLQGIEGPQLRAETPLERKGWVTIKVTDEWQLYERISIKNHCQNMAPSATLSLSDVDPVAWCLASELWPLEPNLLLGARGSLGVDRPHLRAETPRE